MRVAPAGPCAVLLKQLRDVEAVDAGDFLTFRVPLEEWCSMLSEGARPALIATKERLLGLLAERRRALITRAVTRGLDPHAPLRGSGIPWLGEIPPECG